MITNTDYRDVCDRKQISIEEHWCVIIYYNGDVYLVKY